MSGRNAIANPFRIRGIRAALTTILAHFSVFLCASQPVLGQVLPRSNVEVFGDLAVSCIGEVPEALDSLLLEPSEGMPYLRPRLTSSWRSGGLRVFLTDSLTSAALMTSTLHRLRYRPEDALVSYESVQDSRLRRTISLALAHTLLAPSGLVLDDGRCREQYSDTIDRDQILIVERDPYPEARGEIPVQRSWKQWAEPAVLAVSVGVVAYLFFSIRSS